jgi:teichoic acid transport system ATP-binding protein
MTEPQEGRRPSVVVDHVSVEYKVKAGSKGPGGRRETRTRTVKALKDVSFVAYENDSIGVVGTNGSGKSTLMRAIVGLTPVSSGAIHASANPSMLGVGAALIKDLSGEQNVILGGLAMGFTRAEIEAAYDDVVAFSGLGDFIDLPMRTYSSGMVARLKFAIAAARAHEILIVDEALAVGDKDFRERSEARIREIRDQAGTVFLVSHSMKSILDTCNRVLWVEKGELLMDGDPREVIRAYRDGRR